MQEEEEEEDTNPFSTTIRKPGWDAVEFPLFEEDRGDYDDDEVDIYAGSEEDIEDNEDNVDGEAEDTDDEEEEDNMDDEED